MPVRPTRKSWLDEAFKGDQKFFIAGRAKQGRFGDTQPAQPQLGGHEGTHFIQHPGVNRRIADDARAAVGLGFACFKLWFHQGEDTTRRPQQRNCRRQNFSQRNEGAIYHHPVHRRERRRHPVGRQVAGIGFFHNYYARILAEFPGELAGADVHGIDFRRAVLEQAVGEATGGSAQIHRRRAAHLGREVLQRVLQFPAAATYKTLRLRHRQHGFRADGVAGFARRLAVDRDAARHDGALRLLAASAKSAFNESLVQALAHSYNGLRRELQNRVVRVIIGCGQCGESPLPPQAMNLLDTLLHDEIARRGPMSFRRFMELALYHPELGYYERRAAQIGRTGDFFTSVSVGPLFGELLAFRFAGWLEALARDAGPVQIVEAGAHDGALAADILGWLERQRPELFRNLDYYLIEPSPRRHELQRQRLQPFAAKVSWRSHLDEPSANPVTGVIFSNELLDAFPVHRLGWDARQRQWFEWAVAVEGGVLAWARLPLTSNLQEAALQSLSPALGGGDFSSLAAVLPDGFTFEYNPEALAWWRTAATALERGWLLTFDYGLAGGEPLRPERTQGTLRAYGGHRVSQDLLAQPGQQDLTAHVNFAALQAAGELVGLGTVGLVSQEHFLMSIAAEILPVPKVFGGWSEERARQLRTLVHPNHLGRSFRVLTQARQAVSLS